MVLETLHEILREVQLAVFGGLGVVAFLQWRRRRDPAAGWLAATFAVLALVVVTSRLLPEHSESDLVQWIRKLEVAVIVFFPYFLFRFAMTFQPTSLWLEIPAGLLTAVVVVGVFFVGELPEEGEPRSDAYVTYIYMLLAQWVFLTVVVASRLWRGGKGQPVVAKKRMRTLAVGAVGLALLLVVAGASTPSEDVTVNDIVTQLAGIAIGPFFLLGFAPPGFVRSIWRREAIRKFEQAEAELMEALRPSEVATTLLPHVSELSGGRGSVLIDPRGKLLGYHGLTPDEAESWAARIGLSDQEQEDWPSEVVTASVKAGRIAVITSSYTPFFGQEEIDLLRRLGFLADLALTRADLFEDLRETHLQLAEAQQIARVGSWEWDLTTGRMAWSEELYRILGLDPGASAPTREQFYEFVMPEDRAALRRATEEAAQSEAPYEIEYRLKRPDGQVRVLQGRGRALRDRQGRPQKMIGTAQDITERKAQEELRDRFIANAAHELRTPMTTLVGFVEVLSGRREKLSEEQVTSSLAVMSRSASRLTSLVNNLLDISKLQAGALRIRTEDVDVAGVSERVIESNPPPDGRSVTLNVEDHPVVTTDPLRLEQVLENLVINAYRYGGPNIVVEAANSGEEATIAVCDDGPGVEGELVPTLFEPFASGATSAEVGGSGLGLAIARMLTEALGGRIHYEPNEPTGARFVLRLRRA